MKIKEVEAEGGWVSAASLLPALWSVVLKLVKLLRFKALVWFSTNNHSTKRSSTKGELKKKKKKKKSLLLAFVRLCIQSGVPSQAGQFSAVCSLFAPVRQNQ